MGKIEWPNGAKCAVNLSFDNLGDARSLSTFGHAQGQHSSGRYADKAGLRRVLELLDRHGIKATFFVEGWNAVNNTDLVREIISRGHEVGAHGWMHERAWNELTLEEEKGLIERVTSAFEKTLGFKPVGWRSPGALLTENSIKLLFSAGYLYDSDFVDEDEPYIMTIDGRFEGFVQIPFDWALDDAVYYAENKRFPDEVLKYWREEFTIRYDEVGFFNPVCHPYYSGRPARLRALEELIRFIERRPGVWFARCVDIAEWVLRTSRTSK